MDKNLYLGMSGAKLVFEAQAVHANNLANANTYAFKADKPVFKIEAVDGDLYDTVVHSTSDDVATDLSPGQIVTTGRELDVAIKNEGWIAIQMPDGQERLTRDGNFKLTAQGVLVTSQGYSVLGNGGPIAIPPAEKIEFAPDGSISIRGQGQPANALALIDRIKLVNPDKQFIRKDNDGTYKTIDGEGYNYDASVTLVAEALEGSNVNPMHEFMHIISMARSYEMQVKLMSEYKSIDEQASTLMRVE